MGFEIVKMWELCKLLMKLCNMNRNYCGDFCQILKIYAQIKIY